MVAPDLKWWIIALFVSLWATGACAQLGDERRRISRLMASRLRAHLAKLSARIPSNTAGVTAAVVNSILSSIPGDKTDQETEDLGGDHRILRAIAEEEDKPAEQREDYHASVQAYLTLFSNLELKRQGSISDSTQLPDRTKSSSWWMRRLYGSGEEDYCGPKQSARESLVVVIMGDQFDASKYMTDPQRSNWDIVGIHYGKNAEFECPLCKAVYHASGPKWRLAWGFTLLPDWQEYRKNYSAITFADDDLTLDVCTLNTVFNVMKAFKILMAQPSLCDRHWSYTLWHVLYQQPENILRYVTMNEIMAPVFEMDFFQNFIRPTLYNAYFGWGLDFVWPFLLRFPRDKIAVVDLVCMSHPKSTQTKAGSLYKAKAPINELEEEALRFNEYGYTAAAVKALGYPFQVAEAVGVVPKPSKEDSLLESSHKALRSRLGLLYPLLFLAQSGVCLLTGALLIYKQAWCRLGASRCHRQGLLALLKPPLAGAAKPPGKGCNRGLEVHSIQAWCQHIKAQQLLKAGRQLA